MTYPDGWTDEQLTKSIGEGDVVAECPVAGCYVYQWMSPDDPDGSFNDLLSHINAQHPGIDCTPAVLWPSIKYRKED